MTLGLFKISNQVLYSNLNICENYFHLKKPFITPYISFTTEIAPYPSIEDKGPLMTSILSPDTHKTHIMGIKMEWECQAFADGQITYRWYKDNVVGHIYFFLKKKQYSSLVQDYFLETVEERDYFGRKTILGVRRLFTA